MQVYNMKKEVAMEKAKTFLNLSCNYKISENQVEEVFIKYIFYEFLSLPQLKLLRLIL